MTCGSSHPRSTFQRADPSRVATPYSCRRRFGRTSTHSGPAPQATERKAPPAPAQGPAPHPLVCISGCNSSRNDSIALCKKPSPAEEGPDPAHPAPPHPPTRAPAPGHHTTRRPHAQRMGWITEPIGHAPEVRPVALGGAGFDPGPQPRRSDRFGRRTAALPALAVPDSIRKGRLNFFRGSDYVRPARVSLANR